MALRRAAPTAIAAAWCLALLQSVDSANMLGAAAPPPPVAITVSKPFALASHEVLQEAGMHWPDASLYAIRRADGEYTFWGGGGRMPWQALNSQGDRLSASSVRFANVTIQGYPCPTNYSDPCLLQHTAPTNVGMWPANVYHIGGDEVLAFTHMEFRYHPVGTATGGWAVRHGLGYSNDAGQSFHWCGYIVAPAGDAGRSLQGETLSPNMGLSNYIIKDGFFQLYYHDEVTPGVEGPTGPGQQVAVARALVSDVVDFARQRKAAPWFKYFNGTWEQPAVGGGTFTPLNLPPQGYMHGDAIYVAAIDQYAIVSQSGDRKQNFFSSASSDFFTSTSCQHSPRLVTLQFWIETLFAGATHAADWHKEILIAFSTDGITWSAWQRVFSDGAYDPEKATGDVHYPSLMSYGPNNEIADATFGVVFQYRGGNVSKAPFQFNMVNVTVRANK